MKKLLLCAVLSLLAINLPAADPPKPAQAPKLTLAANDDPYAAGRFGLAYFASYRVREFDGVLDRFGSGGEFSYSITRTLTLAVEGISENPQHSFFDEGGINSKWYLPISKSGFAAYGLLGYTYRFEDLPGGVRHHQAGWKKGGAATTIDEDRRSRMNAGAGIELRGKRNGLFGIFTVGAFADGRWTHDFDTIGHALFRVGANFGFGR